MAKSKRPTLGKFKMPDIQPGKEYSREEFIKIKDGLSGGVRRADDIKSAKDFVSYVNRLISTMRVYTTSGHDPITNKEVTKFVFPDRVEETDLFTAKYNRSLGGYILNRDGSSNASLFDKRFNKSMEDNDGYSVRSITVNGVKYDNVITKKIKTKGGRTIYEIMK